MLPLSRLLPLPALRNVYLSDNEHVPRGSSLVWLRAEESFLNSSNTNVNSLLFMPRDSVDYFQLLCLFCLSYNEKLSPPSWLCYPCGCCRPSDSFSFPLRRKKVAADSFSHNSFPRVNYLLPSDNPLTNKCIRNRDLLLPSFDFRLSLCSPGLFILAVY